MSRRKKKVSDFVLRRKLVLLGIALCFLALFLRAVELKFVEAERLQEAGSSRHFTSVKIPAHRGVIYDRNGELLAISTPVYSACANPRQLAIENKQLVQLGRLLNIGHKKLKSKLDERSDRHFMYLQRRLTPEMANQFDELSIPGIFLQKEYRRYYPAGEIAAHIIGLTDIDDRGLEGLELAYEDWLQGKPGRKRVMRDATGKIIADVEQLQAARHGRALHLSIDKRIQYLAYKELKRAVQKHNASAGSAVVMTVHTGEVLALVNMPSLNPNNRANASYNMIRNRAITDEFEPGSTIKPFVIANALEAGVISRSTHIDTTPGHFNIGTHRVTDLHNYGLLSIDKILVKSSNVGMSRIALDMPVKLLWSGFQKLGFGEPTGSGFPGETAGQLSNYTEWGDVSRATLSYGYGLSVSALQLARAYSALGNGGVLLPASLVKLKGSARGQRVFKAETTRAVVSMLENVASTEGTAKLAAVEGFRVAGKTGTVHKLVNGQYADDQYLSLFAGLAPASDPQFAIVIIIDEPRHGDYFGGQVAAPVFSSIASGVLRIMNFVPEYRETESSRVLFAHQGGSQ